MQARPTGSPGARAALRAATRDVHERLHVTPAFLAVSEGRLGREGYGDLLRQLAGLYFALAPDLKLDASRMSRLAADLATLGASQPEALACDVPHGHARKLGWQYVFEGSIFGGQVIYRQLDYLFGEAQAGRRFFAVSPGAAGRWRDLCEEIERIGADERSLQEMIAGSCEAFAYFERHLMEEPVHG